VAPENSENRVDDDNHDYLGLQNDIKDDESKNSPAYHAMTRHEHERARLRKKQLKRWQEKGADGAQETAARLRLQEAKRSFVEKCGKLIICARVFLVLWHTVDSK
jgi:hypothetical protein